MSSDANTTDELLINRAQSGDRSAFDDLVHRHERRAYQYAYRLTNNSDVAMDIVTDAFVRVFNALNNFRGQSAFSTWLYRIITNCYLDHNKREKNRAAVSLDSPSEFNGQEVERQIEDPTAPPDQAAEKHERERMVQEALLKLPEYQRAMLVMYHVEMKSYEEIAEVLDLPLGTVKSRLNRARLGLRELLTKNEELFRIG